MTTLTKPTMNKEQVIEGNKLVAEFMGLKFDESKTDDHKFYTESNQGTWTSKRYVNPKYHSSWDWLMPVVDKIIDTDITAAPQWTGYRVEIVPRGYVKISGFPMPTITTNVSIEGSLINAVYKAVIQFIQWYNQQTPTP